MRLPCYFIAAMTAFALAACDRSIPPAPIEEPFYTELHWVGTDVVYSTAAVKHDHSIIFFMADWCGWCTRLKKEALSDSTVIQILGESFNIVNINYEADSSVVSADSTVTCRQFTHDVFGIRGFPTLVFCDREGDVIGTAPGYRSTASMIELLEKVRDGNY